MLLAQQVYKSVEEHPEIWTNKDFWLALFLGLGILGAIQFKLIRDQMEAKYSGENTNLKSRIELLEQQVNTEDEFYKSTLKQLNKHDIEALKLIKKFEKNPPQDRDSDNTAYSVEDLEKQLAIDGGKANSIIKKLKKLELANCWWENLPTYPFLGRPINEEKPVRLTELGREFLVFHKHKSDSAE
jgi:hypothetical protein